MEAVGRVKISLPTSVATGTRDEFWASYWQLSSERKILESHAVDERRIFSEFSSELARRLPDRYRPDSIRVEAVRYGSIELLLAVIGGEELLSEMFWTLVEFHAPAAFNSAAGGNPPVNANVSHGGVGGTHGGGAHGGSRLTTAFQSPLVAMLLGAIVIAGLLYGMKESVENELNEVRHDYALLVSKLAEQNNVLTTGVLLKLGIVLPSEWDDEQQLRLLRSHSPRPRLLDPSAPRTEPSRNDVAPNPNPDAPKDEKAPEKSH